MIYSAPELDLAGLSFRDFHFGFPALSSIQQSRQNVLLPRSAESLCDRTRAPRHVPARRVAYEDTRRSGISSIQRTLADSPRLARRPGTYRRTRPARKRPGLHRGQLDLCARQGWISLYNFLNRSALGKDIGNAVNRTRHARSVGDLSQVTRNTKVGFLLGSVPTNAHTSCQLFGRRFGGP
jgi:hypothetical protein